MRKATSAQPPAFRHLATSFAAVLLLAALILTAAPPAAAYLPPLTGGMRITNSDGSGCSIAFADPWDPWLIYTTAHCYETGQSPVVSVGRYRVGTYRPDLVYDTNLDLVAIQLYEGINTQYAQCTGIACYPMGTIRTPAVGDYVCKFGASTLQTCGPITHVWTTEFSMKLPVSHGDSGGPVYQIDYSDGTIHLVGVTTGISRRDRANAYATRITSISDLLQRTWGSSWQLG